MYSYDYSAYTGGGTGTGGLGNIFSTLVATLVAFKIIALVVAIIIFLVIVISRCFLLKKAGEKFWKGLIPIYGDIMLCKIIYGRGWFFVFYLVPIWNMIFMLGMLLRIPQCFNKDLEWGVFMIVAPLICLPALAFGKAEYLGPIWKAL